MFCSINCIAVARSRRSGDVRLDSTSSLTCQWCQGQLGEHQDRFCSTECEALARAKRTEASPKPLPLCRVCGVQLRHRNAQRCRPCATARNVQRIADWRRRKMQEAKEARPCVMCAKVFTPIVGTGLKLTCSEVCSARYRHAGVFKNAKRRAREAGAIYQPVMRLQVFARDGWACRNCGIGTPRELVGSTAGNAPQAVHIVPFRLGGGHDPKNVVLFCRSCSLTRTRPRVARSAGSG